MRKQFSFRALALLLVLSLLVTLGNEGLLSLGNTTVLVKASGDASAGGIGSYCINKFSGQLFDYADQTQIAFLGFQGKPAGYFIVFCYCAVAYVLGWICLKVLVPRFKAVEC